MPYKSKKQQGFFHTKTARKKGITKKMVKEYDSASRGVKLPETAIAKAAKKAASKV